MGVSKIALIIVTIVMLIIVSITACFFMKKCSDYYLLRPQVAQQSNSANTELPPFATPQLVLPPTVAIQDPIIQPPLITQQISLAGQSPALDPVKTYDYNKLNDPLEEPTKRVDRYLLGPIEYRRMFNYPVRGYPDNPRWMGILISEDNDPNKILKLFGRQRYPNSNQYEYYTMINMGFDQIKVHIDRKKELYNDDEVTVSELNKKYKVKLNKDDDSYYNPYF